jgi:hypothetical protein
LSPFGLELVEFDLEHYNAECLPVAYAARDVKSGETADGSQCELFESAALERLAEVSAKGVIRSDEAQWLFEVARSYRQRGSNRLPRS